MRALSKLVLLLSAFSAFSAVSIAAEPLPGTKPLTEEGDLATKMVAGMHKYLDRETAASVENRKQFWKVDTSSGEKYAKSIEPNRARLRKYLGVVDDRLPPKLEYVGGPDRPALLAETTRYRVYAVRWAVLPGVDAEGLLLEPAVVQDDEPRMCAVAVPDAAHTPEQVAGLAAGVPEEAQFARRLAENRIRVLVPAIIDRRDELSVNPKLNRAANIPHREFVHRMAFEMGRTLLGYEVQKVLAGVDWLLHSQPKKAPKRVGVMGHGEGGRVALYAGALDDRVRATSLEGGSFGPQEGVAERPLDRNVWGLLTEFGDAELAAYCYHTPLGGEWGKTLRLHLNAAPVYAGPAAPRPGRGGAAPGTVPEPDAAAVKKEGDRVFEIGRATGAGGGGSVHGIRGADGKLDPTVPLRTGSFLNVGAVDEVPGWKPEPLTLHGKLPDPAARHRRQFDQLVAHVQKLWRDSDATRKEFWKKADASSPEAWEKSCDWYREYLHSEVIGKLPEPSVPLNPRSRQVYDEPKFTGYEVVLDVYQDVFAQGILLLPKDLKPGEKRPVVVCQHGLEGTPRHTIDPEPKRVVYNQFSRRLVELGYIVYAPQNPYYGKNEFRQLQRKANPLKLSLFSFIIRQHQRTIDWLEALPNVDPKRIAFYGLSYGGKTAMRVPAVEKRYCLSICSGDFNEWIGKNVSVDLDRSYMWTGEYEMYEFDLGNTFNYAEMAHLIAPRPFMVERGHDDGVGTDEMVASEYAKVRYLYQNRLKLGDRTAIEFFPGGHEIRAKGTFEFLRTHLGYPK
jgi:dienelactone hydrolase